MRYVCAECGSSAEDAAGCPRCRGPVFPDTPGGLEMVRNYRELGQLTPRSWDPGLVLLAAVGLSYPLWSWLLLVLSPASDNPLALAQWPAVGTGAIAWMVASWVERRRTGAAELRLDDRLGVTRPSLGQVLRSPTFWLILTGALFLIHSLGSSDDIARFGFSFADLRGGRRLWTLVTSTFTHVSLGHLGWNCLFLLFVAGGVESRTSRGAFVALFLLGAIAGKLAHAAFLDEGVVMVGMSGAVMAIAGAHVVVDPWRRYASSLFPGELPAVLSLPLVAVLGAVGDVLRSPSSAWAAHLGGFVAGLLLGLVLRAARLARVAPGAGPAALA